MADCWWICCNPFDNDFLFADLLQVYGNLNCLVQAAIGAIKMNQVSSKSLKNNVLILCPKPSAKGGVSNYYMLVRKHFCSQKISISFYYTGMSGQKGFWVRVFKTMKDILTIPFIIARHDLVVLNPSLDFQSIIRDGFFHMISKRVLRKKTIVFFRGWHLDFERLIDEHGKRIFKRLFNPEIIIVLGEQIKKKIISWGFDSSGIIVETTAFEMHQLAVCNDPLKIIFLSRLSKGKGCLEAIKTIELLVYEFPMVKLYVVGDGELCDQMKQYVANKNLANNIEFTGWLEGEDKYRLISQCGVMILPSHGEGLPNSILEAMGFGLVIVTRPVGGIPDIIINGENGFLIESLDPKDFAEKVKSVLQNVDSFKKISDKNKLIAMERFEIKKVVDRLEGIFLEVMKNSANDKTSQVID